jgi:hypothetical protein
MEITVLPKRRKLFILHGVRPFYEKQHQRGPISCVYKTNNNTQRHRSVHDDGRGPPWFPHPDYQRSTPCPINLCTHNSLHVRTERDLSQGAFAQAPVHHFVYTDIVQFRIERAGRQAAWLIVWLCKADITSVENVWNLIYTFPICSTQSKVAPSIRLLNSISEGLGLNMSRNA